MGHVKKKGFIENLAKKVNIELFLKTIYTFFNLTYYFNENLVKP